MSLKSGFFNSVNHDRKYNAEDFARLVNAIVTDGVVTTKGEQFMTVPGEGLSVNVKSGFAWFNSTWSMSEDITPLTLDPADVTRTRLDAVVIDIDHRDAARENKLMIVKGAPSTSPVKPSLANDEKHHQHALAYVSIPPAATSLTAANIDIRVGKDDCPFASGKLEAVSIEDLFNAWEVEFNEWFDNLKAQLGDNVVTNLQQQIDDRVKISDKATTEDIAAGTPNKWVDAEEMDSFVYGIDMALAPISGVLPDGWVKCDGSAMESSSNLFKKIGYLYGISNDKSTVISNQFYTTGSMYMSEPFSSACAIAPTVTNSNEPPAYVYAFLEPQYEGSSTIRCYIQCLVGTRYVKRYWTSYFDDGYFTIEISCGSTDAFVIFFIYDEKNSNCKCITYVRDTQTVVEQTMPFSRTPFVWSDKDTVYAICDSTLYEFKLSNGVIGFDTFSFSGALVTMLNGYIITSDSYKFDLKTKIAMPLPNDAPSELGNFSNISPDLSICYNYNYSISCRLTKNDELVFEEVRPVYQNPLAVPFAYEFVPYYGVTMNTVNSSTYEPNYIATHDGHIVAIMPALTAVTPDANSQYNNAWMTPQLISWEKTIRPIYNPLDIQASLLKICDSNYARDKKYCQAIQDMYVRCSAVTPSQTLVFQWINFNGTSDYRNNQFIYVYNVKPALPIKKGFMVKL